MLEELFIEIFLLCPIFESYKTFAISNSVFEHRDSYIRSENSIKN